MIALFPLADWPIHRQATAVLPVPRAELSFRTVSVSPPLRAVFGSTAFHCGVFCALTAAGLLTPPANLNLRTPRQVVAQSSYRPLTTDALAGYLAANLPPSDSTESGRSSRGSGRTAATVGSAASTAKPKAIYAGPQEIVSNLPDATSSVQTIRRPDLAVAPKLKYAIRLQNMVLLPAPAAPTLVTPRDVPAPMVAQPLPVEAVTPLNNPTLPVIAQSNPALPSKPEAIAKSAVRPAAEKLGPVPPLTGGSDREVAKAAIVLNAVAVPVEATVTIPDAELNGSFAVTATSKNARTSTTDGGKSESASASPSSPGKSSGTKGSSTSRAGNGVASGTRGNGGAGTFALPISGGRGNGVSVVSGRNREAGAASGIGSAVHGTETGNGSAANASAGSGPESGTAVAMTGTGAGSSGSGGVSGISITGGAAAKPAETLPSIAHAQSYGGLTIIAGGSSGGATRDLGVFGRNELVYTVFIPMSDAGGADWSMQYSVIGASPAGRGLLSPPMASKKVHASQSEVITNDGPVFILGIVDDKGVWKLLRALRPQDARSKAAITALAEWKFEPAQMEGKPVATKVLIGAAVLFEPAAEQH